MKKTLLSSLLGAAALLSVTTSFAASGGPDSFGYTWKDSNEPGGPAYNWIEIATPAGGSGTLRTAVACDDCHEANIPLGFNFPYYGASMANISIGSNGVVYFENVYLGLSNSCMPGTPGYTMTQYNFIAHMWDDLAPNYQGGIYTQAFPNYYVIEYYDIVPCCATGDGDTWQVILFSNGNILMQYKELSNQGLQTDFTIGIQNNPTTGLQYRCDAAGIAPANGRAILFSPPTVNCSAMQPNIFPATTALCTPASAVLSAGATSIAQTWSTAATTPTITVNTAGSYSVVTLDESGCTFRDTANVVAFTPPVADLGPDATGCESVTLDPQIAAMNYLWSDNSTNATLTVTSSGTYSVVVTDPASGCTDDDEINVTVNPLPVVALGSDIAQCEGTVTLDAGNPGETFLWSDMSTAQTLMVNASGTYYVTVTNATTACTNSDTINVTINTNPVVDLGADTASCATPIMLDAANAGLNFMWSDMSTNQMLTATTSGAYFVDVTDPSTGCTASDTIDVAINANPTVNLGSDQTQCGGSVMLDAGNAGANFMWSDSSATQTISVSSSGSYSVIVTDPATGCMSGDTVNVTINTVLTVDLGSDTSTCGGSVILDAGNTGANFMWSDSTSGQTLTVTTSGTYYVTVVDPNTGCTGTDTMTATIHSLPTVTLMMPSAAPCMDDASITLSGGSPAGGSYSGPGVTAGVFDPSVGAGTHMITYMFTDTNGCSASAVQSIVVNACVGIEEQTADAISIYPNPSTGLLNIVSNSSENTIVVFNAIGEAVFTQQSHTTQVTIDLSAQTVGVYFVQVMNANGTYYEKVVLQK
jgi:hypothetical protein